MYGLSSTPRVLKLYKETQRLEIYPVSKSSLYLNQNMKFLINECYHKMCESCVDRICKFPPFVLDHPRASSAAPKSSISKQIFENIAIEREVDIRKRVHKVFNKHPSDFDTLKQYNDYLEEVEFLNST
ncbi:MAT1-domain-containing protein [Terfezia boudieri ATCC MYA-4762]|uniref:MAT1-domain-containing protein n=1 Tax=Terfezia boudieri ATCC MYA-4762 TaxID=1051890 RepID=A0A3N4LI31_9PEZI|nr:MAT1-domain-containing protein [Terfezia boudieri ATCC MYA-4762]